MLAVVMKFFVVSVVLATLLSPGIGTASESVDSTTGPAASSLVLITLDTTRADAIGAYGGGEATPALDDLAAHGTRWTRAVAPAPLTLPSHATLLTGLDPPTHGVRSNGGQALPAEIPTLAEVLAGRGFATAAFVGSRVLDARFGLDRGFDLYDDAMLAERVGEYGYPERSADAVTDAALAWLDELPAGSRFFLWVHYYDPHAPYDPPEAFRGASVADNYRGEVAFVDSQVGSLLEGVRNRDARPLIAAVGDHGEALGDHGERSHGIFLYTSVIEVPMIVAGPGVPSGRAEPGPVAIRRLPATLLGLLGVDDGRALPGPVLSGLGEGPSPEPEPVYSEAMMPLTVYGWAPLTSVTEGRWRYIEAPRPELYDLIQDPQERTNLIEKHADEAARLAATLAEIASTGPMVTDHPVLDADTTAALTALGYLEGPTEGAGDGIDPKDGIGLLASFEEAKRHMARSQFTHAASILSDLVDSNPSNVPFLNRLAEAQLAAGLGEQAVATRLRARELNPGSQFLALSLADTYRAVGRTDDARRGYRTVLEIDPRSAPAWLGLAALSEDSTTARKLLAEGLGAGAESLVVMLELARLEAEAGELEAASRHLERAAALAPDAAVIPLEQARVDEAAGRLDQALDHCRAAAELEPANPLTALCTGRIYLEKGNALLARPHLRRAAVLGRGTAVGEEAEALLNRIED
jgi:arylsulfatase A-like enzyme/Flp pilus assembly protein TadD